MAIVSVADVVAAALGQVAGAGGKLRGNGGVGSHPVGQGILAVLDDSPTSLITVICLSSFTRSHRRVVDELQEVLAVARNNGDLLAVLTEGVKLVRVGSLDLLTRNVGQLGLGHKRLGLGTDKLLLQDDNLGRVGFLVLELGNLVGDFLLACAGSAFTPCSIQLNGYRDVEKIVRTVAAGLHGSLNVSDALHGNAVLVVTVDILVLQLANLVQKNTKLISDVRDVFISALAPDGKLLL